MRSLILQGVSENNLKHIDLEIPLGKAIVVTGPSGSGKSSLAFNTVYAEGQRRYMQSLSTYARQFLERFHTPDVEKIENIPPTIALEQINPVRNSRATVGTTTEIYDYLRVIFSKVGTEYHCGVPMERCDPSSAFEQIKKQYAGKSLLLTFEKELPKTQIRTKEMLEELMRSGFVRILVKGEVVRTESVVGDKKLAGKKIEVIVDRFRFTDPDEALASRVAEGMQQSWAYGAGTSQIWVEDARSKGKKYKKGRYFYEGMRCPKCGKMSTPKSAAHFSFNSPIGACENCKGFGNTLTVDEDLIVPNSKLTLAQGAIDPFTKPSLAHWQRRLFEFCTANKIDADLPWEELSKRDRKKVFDGGQKFPGVHGVFKFLEKDKYKMRIRVFISRYVSPKTCEVCEGNRLNDETLNVRLGEYNIADVCAMPFREMVTFLKNLKLSARDTEIIKDVRLQLSKRLDFLVEVGLEYLTSDRLAKTLSGGEYQRILLATQLSQGLTDTLYVLDEPSIGLHPRDTGRLMTILNRLLGLGNSLLVVEHDPELIEWAEHVIDMGPGSGSRGGEVVFSGSKSRFLRSEHLSAEAVRNWRVDCRNSLNREISSEVPEYLEIFGASGNNLKNIDVAFPLGQLVAITGVSGSGKSTLIVDTLYQALAKIFHGKSKKIEKFKSIAGFEFLSDVQLIDQSPIGTSARSNPLTFIKGYDEIRRLLSGTMEAQARNLTPGHFSFNVKGGRCDECEGEGRNKVDMVFMEDVWIKCETCEGKRFKPNVLGIKYKGKNINDILQMTIEEASEFFRASSTLRQKLGLLQEVGLGYLQLGQPGYTLSGGEAQRIKIARELSGTSFLSGSTLFILDEPTTGLHFDEIKKLLNVLARLVKAGHSIIVIEHNVQVICSADYVIDLGPDGGEKGGTVTDMGTPKLLAQKKCSSTGLYLSEILNEK